MVVAKHVADLYQLMRRPLTPQQRADVEEVMKAAADRDPLLKWAMEQRCERGLDCDHGPFDPPKRCAKCDRSLR